MLNFIDITNESSFFKAILEGNIIECQRQLEVDQTRTLANARSVHNAEPLVFALHQDNSITPAMLAARLGNTALINILYQYGANLRAVDGEKFTVLHHAVSAGQIAMVDHLLSYYSTELSLSSRTIHGFSTLMCAIWANQPAMAFHLLCYYCDQMDYTEKSNNAFRRARNIMWSFDGGSIESKMKDIKDIYADELNIQGHDAGLAMEFMFNEKLEEKKNALRKKVIAELDLTESLKDLKLEQSLRKEPVVLIEKAKALLEKPDLPLENKKMINEALNSFTQFQELCDLMRLAGDINKLQSQITSIPPATLLKILHWPGIVQHIAQLKNQDLVNQLFTLAVSSQECDALARLIQGSVISESTVLACGQSEEYEPHILLLYFSLALVNSLDATAVVHDNLMEFIPYIKDYLATKNTYSDPARWLIIHSLMNGLLKPGEGKLGEVNPDLEMKAPLIFLHCAMLSDRDPNKLPFLQRFAEDIMHSNYKHCKTPYLLFKAMFGMEALCSKPLSDLVSELYKTPQVYLPLRAATLEKQEATVPHAESQEDCAKKVLHRF